MAVESVVPPTHSYGIITVAYIFTHEETEDSAWESVNERLCAQITTYLKYMMKYIAQKRLSHWARYW